MGAQYDAAAREAADKPATFRLCGERFETHSPVDGVIVDGFAVMKFLKAGMDEADGDVDLDDLRARSEKGDETAREELGMLSARQNLVFFEFLEAALPRREFARFERLCRRKQIGIEQIIQVSRDLMSAMFGRPTSPSSDSVVLPIGTGASSTDGAATTAPQSMAG